LVNHKEASSTAVKDIAGDITVSLPARTAQALIDLAKDEVNSFFHVKKNVEIISCQCLGRNLYFTPQRAEREIRAQFR
jgi:hypothetical protein